MRRDVAVPLGLAGACALAGVLEIPGLQGSALTPRVALAWVVLPGLLLATPRGRLRPAGGLAAAALMVWALASGLWVAQAADWAEEMWWLDLVACATLLGGAWGVPWRALGAAALVNVAIAWAQCAGWQGLPDPVPPAGTFVNRVVLSEFLVPVCVGLALTQRRVWALVVASGLMATGSKEGLLALGLVGVWWLAGRSRVLAVVLAGACALALGLALATPYGLGSSADRLRIWWDTLGALTLWGHGLGSWYTGFPEWAPHYDTLASRPFHAHNDWLELLYELGVPGGLLAGTVLWRALRGSLTPERAALAALALCACVAFPLHAPMGGLVFGLCLGACLRGHVRGRSLAWLVEHGWGGALLAGLEQEPECD